MAFKNLTLVDFGFKPNPLYRLNKRLPEYFKMNNEENKTVQNPKILGEVELPKLDLKQYEGKVSEIAEIEYREHIEHGLYCLVKSKPLNDNTDNPVYATRILGLIAQKDETGEITGYGWGSETKAGLFLKKMGVTKLSDLVDKKIVVRFEITKNKKEVLTF